MATEAVDYAGLLDRASHARLVLLGSASHGTHEFHRERAAITRRLISDAGFTTVAIEGDWPDAYRVNRYVRGLGDDAGADAALRDFRRFPAWLWRNADVAEFVLWLREHNDALPITAPRVGFYGLDLYGVHASIQAVVGYLDAVDPAAGRRARARYDRFARSSRVPQDEAAERATVQQLVELRELARQRPYDEERGFFAEQSARLLVDAVEHQRALARSEAAAWNVRARHMAGTLVAIAAHLEPTGGPAKVVVWAHNTHVGDASATEMGRAGELSLGQLVRRRAPAATVLVGFTTYRGTVTAARDWDELPEVHSVPRARKDSYEAHFHTRGLRRLVLEPADLPGSRPERAIGVVYRPVEDASHYLDARIGDQFDLVVHLDETH